MATTVLYVCDRCKEEQTGATIAQFWQVAITCETVDGRTRSQYYPPMKRQTAEWCRKCVDEVGVFTPTILRAEEEVKPPTLEDMIREIVKQEQLGD